MNKTIKTLSPIKRGYVLKNIETIYLYLSKSDYMKSNFDLDSYISNFDLDSYIAVKKDEIFFVINLLTRKEAYEEYLEYTRIFQVLYKNKIYGLSPAYLSTKYMEIISK